MGFERKWSDELKQAIVAAVLDHGMSVPQAVRAANAGELPGRGRGVPAAPIKVAYTRDLVSDERRRRKLQESARAAPGEIVGRSLGRLAAILDREVERAESQARRGKVNPDHILKLARAGVEVAKLAKQAQAAPDKVAGPASPEKPDFIGSLAGD
jgi:hypothetical protein